MGSPANPGTLFFMADMTPQLLIYRRCRAKHVFSSTHFRRGVSLTTLTKTTLIHSRPCPVCPLLDNIPPIPPSDDPLPSPPRSPTCSRCPVCSSRMFDSPGTQGFVCSNSKCWFSHYYMVPERLAEATWLLNGQLTSPGELMADRRRKRMVVDEGEIEDVERVNVCKRDIDEVDDYHDGFELDHPWIRAEQRTPRGRRQARRWISPLVSNPEFETGQGFFLGTDAETSFEGIMKNIASRFDEGVKQLTGEFTGLVIKDKAEIEGGKS